MTPTLDEQEILQKKFKRFRKKWFKGKDTFTGEELVKCKEAFWKKHNIS